MRFNAPPGWPTPPPGWQPPADWKPDPSWPPAPSDWQLWVPDRAKKNRKPLIIGGITALVVIVVAAIVIVNLLNEDWEQKRLAITGLGRPNSLTVDAEGNLYVTDPPNGQILKLAPGGTDATKLPFTGLTIAGSVAVDPDGNIYATDSTGVFKLEVGSTTATKLTTAGLREPTNVAVDSADNVYVVDQDADRGRAISTYRLLKLTPGASSWTVMQPGPTYPNYPVVDRDDNLYVIDEKGDAEHDFNDVVKKLPKGSDVWADTPLRTDLDNSPTGLAVDDSGNVYLSTLNIINSDAPNHADWVVKSKVLKLDVRANEMTQLPLNDVGAFAGVAADHGSVYVSDEQCNCVLRFTPN